MFRKLFTGMLIAVCATAAMASSTVVDTKGLTEAQVAELKAIAAKKVAETAAQAAAPQASNEKITAGVTLAATWGTQAAAAAEGFAKALGIAARELNVTINDFLRSPAGMLTAALIIWKMAGAALMHAFFGFVILTVGLIMVRIIYKRLFTKGYEQVQYSYLWGAFSGTKMVRIPKSFQDLRNDGEWLAFWVMIIITFMTLVLAGTMF
jgi:hypothetical protein